MKGLIGKRVFISGGCGDIGLAVARRFLEGGARVILADLRPAEEGNAIAKQVSQNGGEAGYVHCDVTVQSSAATAIQKAVEVMGGIDVAIVNAGVVFNQPFLEISEAEWRRTIDVNLTGSYLLSQAAARVIIQNEPKPKGMRGSILFTGSWVQKMPWPGGASYCSSKGGQEMLMKVIAQELAGHGITCNIVAPGMVYAGLTKSICDADSGFRERAESAVPMARMCSADEVAGAFAFLASEEGAYITGISLVVDGGATLVRRD